jgi:hypothetical protein
MAAVTRTRIHRAAQSRMLCIGVQTLCILQMRQATFSRKYKNRPAAGRKMLVTSA